mmetsp:Transcript_88006/g.247325  ORF Transcript_88006/g.247325 Transcript_88006/m.247325 type:complete len:108 (-) Transcript_88006:695-1018(-)
MMRRSEARRHKVGWGETKRAGDDGRRRSHGTAPQPSRKGFDVRCPRPAAIALPAQLAVPPCLSLALPHDGSFSLTVLVSSADTVPMEASEPVRAIASSAAARLAASS